MRIESKNKGNFYAVISILLWCFSGICFRKGAQILQPMTYLSLITFIGVLTASLIHFLQKRKLSQLFLLPLKVVISGFFGITVYTIFLAFAFHYADPEEIGVINLINYLWPLWMVILEMILLKTRTDKKLFSIGLVLGFSGLILSLNIDLSSLGTGNYRPHLLALSGSIFWALYSVLLKKWHIKEEQSGTSFHFTICAVLSLVLAVMMKEEISSVSWNGESFFWVIFGGIGPVGVAYYLWELGIKKGSVSIIASLSYFIPVGSSIAIGLFFSETVSFILIPASILIAAGSRFVKKAALQINS